MSARAEDLAFQPYVSPSTTGLGIPQLPNASPFVALTASLADALQRAHHGTAITVPPSARVAIMNIADWIKRGGLVVLMPAATKFTTLDVVPEPTPLLGTPLNEIPRSGLMSVDPLHAVGQLQDWLNITHAEVASAVAVGETTIYYWKRTGSRPRPSTVRQLWRVHSLAQALVERFGESGARTWFLAGSPSPLQLLEEGEVDRVENAAHAALFRHRDLPTNPFSAFRPEDVEPELEVVARASAPKPRRRARRVGRNQL